MKIEENIVNGLEKKKRVVTIDRRYRITNFEMGKNNIDDLIGLVLEKI